MPRGLLKERSMDRIFELIRAEREAQDVKWGDQSGNSQGRWLVIMMERLGELARVLLNSTLEDARSELIQVAAVAVAWLEALEPKPAAGRPPGCRACSRLLACESVESCPF